MSLLGFKWSTSPLWPWVLALLLEFGELDWPQDSGYLCDMWDSKYLGFLILVCPSVKQVSSSGIVGQDMEPKVVGAIGDCWTGYKWDYLEVDSVLPEVSSSSKASCRLKLFTCTFIYEVIFFSLVWDRSFMDFLPFFSPSFLSFLFLSCFILFRLITVVRKAEHL